MFRKKLLYFYLILTVAACAPQNQPPREIEPTLTPFQHIQNTPTSFPTTPPTFTSTPIPPTATATEEPPTAESVAPTIASVVPSDTPVPEVAEVEATPTSPPAAVEPGEPPGIPEPTPFSRALPYLLIGLGALSIGFGVWYYLGRGRSAITRD